MVGGKAQAGVHGGSLETRVVGKSPPPKFQLLGTLGSVSFIAHSSKGS
jgi:hypothetical protein